jgi:hypothetical protein
MPPEQHPRSGFNVVSTSLNSAEVTPIVLRQTDTVRLVFKPTLVNNDQLPAASVHGLFCYQRKRRADEWTDVSAISLSALHAGEGVKLDIKSSELLKLHRGLDTLYTTVARDGVPTGVHTYIRADEGTVLADIAEMLDSGGADTVLQAFTQWLRESESGLTVRLRNVDGQTLVNFDAAVGAARLQQFVDEATANADNADEPFWQSLLRREPWVISQLYACPFVIIQDQAYVGGKSIQNRGGSIVDYMYTNALTENSLIVEIKTPATRLLTQYEYRNGVYGPSKELGGATQQLLHARQTLQEEYLALVRNTRRPGFNIFATRALLIVGSMPQDDIRRRSFEIYRNAQRGIEIVTFDEMIHKAKLLLDALNS